jgi:hypothetical protein
MSPDVDRAVALRDELVALERVLDVEERSKWLAALARCERECTERPVIRILDQVGRVMMSDNQVSHRLIGTIGLAVRAVPAARERDRVTLG